MGCESKGFDKNVPLITTVPEQKTVVYLEDQLDIIKMVQTYLGASGINVVGLSGLGEFRAYLRDNYGKYSGVILDRNAGEIDGFEMLKEIRRDFCQLIPVTLFSSKRYSEQDDKFLASYGAIGLDKLQLSELEEGFMEPKLTDRVIDRINQLRSSKNPTYWTCPKELPYCARLAARL